MVTTNKESQLNKILFSTVILFFVANFLLTPQFETIGATIAILISEAYLLSSICIYSKLFTR